MIDSHSTTQVVSRLHATVLGKSCACTVNWTGLFLEKTVLAKFPDNAVEIELKWLNESYVDLEVFNMHEHCMPLVFSESESTRALAFLFNFVY